MVQRRYECLLFKGWECVSQVHMLFDAGRKLFLKVCHVNVYVFFFK